jgi:PadR family transcriptional regulator PadR
MTDIEKEGDRDRVALLQGTLDLIVLRSLSTMGPQHAYALAARLEQVAEHPLELNQGTLYPALVRLEQRGWIKGDWQKTENNRDASITRSRSRGCGRWDSRRNAGAGSRGWSTSCSPAKHREARSCDVSAPDSGSSSDPLAPNRRWHARSPRI